MQDEVLFQTPFITSILLILVATLPVYLCVSVYSLEAKNGTMQLSGDQHFIVEYDSSPPVD